MKEPYGEGLASHTGPESCVAVRKSSDEALTGGSTGWVIEPRNSGRTGAPTPSRSAEGNIGSIVTARCYRAPRGLWTPCTYGHILHGNREIPGSARHKRARQAAHAKGKRWGGSTGGHFLKVTPSNSLRSISLRSRARRSRTSFALRGCHGRRCTGCSAQRITWLDPSIIRRLLQGRQM